MRNLRAWALSGLAAVAVGCGKTGPTAPAPTVSPVLSTPGKSAADVPDELHFDQAVLQDSPDNQQPPADKTIAGKATGMLRLEVQKHWDAIPLVDKSGKLISYTAIMETEAGTIELQLRPDVAPSHVRNFIALSRAGFYDGLVFQQIIQQTSDDGQNSIHLVEGGCPVGTGEPGFGHLGYWLPPEISDTMKHEAGSVGFNHDDDPDSAACRFYISLGQAPAMDGNFTIFAQVTKGLNVVKTIAAQPRVADSTTPVKPVVIKTVTVKGG